VKTIFPNQKILNFGYSSGGLNNEIFDFSYNLLNPRSNIKAIVMGVTPFSLTEEARKNEHFHQELKRSTAEIIERKYINPFIFLFDPIKVTDYQENSQEAQYFQKFHKNGWVESYKIPANNEEALSSYEETFSKTNLSTKSIKETLSFVTEMNAIGVKVFGYRPPSTKKMEELENSMINFDEKNFQDMFEKQGGIWVDIPNRYSFSSYDGSHLHFNSAKDLSIILANEINYNREIKP